MSEKLNKLEKQFYSDGFRLGMKASEKPQSKSLLISSVNEMYSIVDEFIDSFLHFARQNNQPADCKRGCSWCCYQPVFALTYEMETLNDFMHLHFDTKQQNMIQKRAATKQQRTENLKGDKLLNSKFPCPLLNEGYCMAYQVRPMACRIYLSTRLDTCLKFYNTPEDRNNFPALLQFPMRVGRLLNEGFKSALKSRGTAVDEFRIEKGILLQPETF